MKKEELSHLLNHFSQEDREYYLSLFQNCSEHVLSEARIKIFQKGEELFQAGKPCRYIYIILSGKAVGIEYQWVDSAYAFREFSEASLLGDYEVFGEIEICNVSIRALDTCRTIMIPARIYLHWMKSDIHALYLRIYKIMRTMTWQVSHERKYLLLNSKERLILFISQNYKQDRQDKQYKIHMTQAELADRIGVSVRTIQRNLLSMEKEGLITVNAGKICIGPEQSRALSKRVEELFER